MKKLKLLVLISFILSLMSCKTLFTSSMRASIQRTDKKRIEKVQFYNDRNIEIEYKSTKASEDIQGGKVVFKAGYYYYSVKIPKHTKAVAEQYDNERLKVHFDEGADNYLLFGDNNSDNDDYYQLYGYKEADGFYVDFEGKRFKVITGGQALLKIKKNYKEDREVKKRKVKGVKVK
jgi:hypothetical protein